MDKTLRFLQKVHKIREPNAISCGDIQSLFDIVNKKSMKKGHCYNLWTSKSMIKKFLSTKNLSTVLMLGYFRIILCYEVSSFENMIQLQNIFFL